MVDTSRLPTQAEAVIADAQNEVFFSAVIFWKTAIKVRLGRRGFNFEPDVILSAAKATGLIELPVDARAAFLLKHLPDHHHDPFERLLIAQAIDAGVVLLTSDAALPACSPLVRLV